jgi:hypothetical protein
MSRLWVLEEKGAAIRHQKKGREREIHAEKSGRRGTAASASCGPTGSARFLPQRERKTKQSFSHGVHEIERRVS